MTELEFAKDNWSKAARIALDYESRLSLIQAASDIDREVWLVSRDKDGQVNVYDGSNIWNAAIHLGLMNVVESVYKDEATKDAE